MDDIDAALGRAWRDDAPWRLLTDLTELPERMAGGEGEARAADLVADALGEAGVRDVREETFGMTRWTRGSTTLAVTDPVERSFEAVALPYCPAADVEAPLVDVGHGTPEEIDAADVDGAVAVATTDSPPERRFVHRMETFGHAVDAGAAGFLFANHVPGQLPPTGSLRFGAEAPIPGVGVSHEAGEWLREYADREGAVRLSVDAETGPGESRFVHGTLGPDTDEEVVVLAHFDAHDVAEGALDNGCGVAVLRAAAGVLAAADLDCRVRVAGVGSEEVGLLGSAALADRLDRDSVRAVVNVDGAGRYRDLRAMTHGSDDVAATVERVREDLGHAVHVAPDPHPFSDHWPFLRAGVPALQLHSRRPPGVAGGERGRGWTHTRADTRDKVDRRDLRSHGMTCALLVRELCRDPPARVDPADLRDALADTDHERGMRAAEIWPAAWD